MTPLQEQIRAALSHSKGAMETARCYFGEGSIGDLDMSTGIELCESALASLKAIQPTGEVGELIAETRAYATRGAWTEYNAGLLTRLADALERQSTTQDAGEGPTVWAIKDGRAPEFLTRFEDDMEIYRGKEGCVIQPLFAAPPTPRSGGLADIAAERRRQVEVEGWAPEHDDEHDDGSLGVAAACYAAPLHLGTRKVPDHVVHNGRAQAGDDEWRPIGSVTVPTPWPWEGRYWKPKSIRANLVRAGALIVAEIERLDRTAAPQPEPSEPEGGE